MKMLASMPLSLGELLEPGELLMPLELRGWVNLVDLLPVGVDVVIDCPRLFSKPVRGTVEAVCFINTFAIDLKTAGARDGWGREWPTGPTRFLDVMFQTARVLKPGSPELAEVLETLACVPAALAAFERLSS